MKIFEKYAVFEIRELKLHGLKKHLSGKKRYWRIHVISKQKIKIRYIFFIFIRQNDKKKLNFLNPNSLKLW